MADVRCSDAAVTSVTVHALHHSCLYNDDDLLCLQQILIGRDLGLSLEAIRRWLDDPQFDRREEIAARRAKLAARAERAESMLRAIDAALAAIDEPVK